MRLFGYYAWHSFVNQLRKLFKTWVLIFLVVCMAIGALIGFGAAMLDDAAGEDEEIVDSEVIEEEEPDIPLQQDTEALELVELIVGGVILAVFAFGAISADKNGSRIFLPADVNLLFASPMKPQSVLLFRLMTQLGTSILASVYLLFQLPNLVLNLGLSIWVALAMIAVWCLTMTIDDTLALEAAVDNSSRVLIVGAGLIGLKCAEGLRDRAASITVCDLADRVLSSILDTECAAVMQKHLEENGITFMLGDSAASFEGNTALMKSGKTIEFDVLVLAVGVRANTALVKDIGGEVNRGIIVNTRMETTIADVYAAGDCTEGEDISFGGRRVLAILPNAYMQGKCAGVNMAGGETVFDKAIPMNSIGFFGLHAMTAGSYYGADLGGELYEEKGNGTLKRLFTKNGFLTGFILIGQIERAGIYTSLIREQTPLHTINFEILKREPALIAFCEENRRKKLGGVV